ncbi:MAG: methyltransferase [Nitrospiraceae bacterium]
MSAPPITTFEQFRDAISAYRLPRVLLTALVLDLFTVMVSRRWSLAELARKLRVSPRGLDILCRNLAMAGLLLKRGRHYRSTSLGSTVLNAKNAQYRGAYLNLLKNHWADWSRLTESVRTGLPVDHDEPEEPGYRSQFTWAMHYRSLESAPRVAAQIHLKGVSSLLDLGGGPGTYAMAFLARNPQLRATVCDRPAALEVAKHIAATHRAKSRLSFLPLDFVQKPIRGRYDVVWYSNVLHIYSARDNQTVFRKAWSALNPGGRLIIQDAFLHDREGLYPTDASLFAVTMLLFTEAGNTYSAHETSGWLRGAGFEKITRLTMRKGTEDWEGGLLEARRPKNSSRPARPTRNSMRR